MATKTARKRTTKTAAKSAKSAKRKTAKRPAKSPAANVKRKTAAKPKTAKRTTAKRKQTAPKTAPKLTAKQTAQLAADRKIAAAATKSMLSNASSRDGKSESSRSPVSVPAVGRVRKQIGRKTGAAIAKSLGFKSRAAMAKHAKTGTGGDRTAIAELSQKLGNPAEHKIRGRKLTAILVELTK